MGAGFDAGRNTACTASFHIARSSPGSTAGYFWRQTRTQFKSAERSFSLSSGLRLIAPIILPKNRRESFAAFQKLLPSPPSFRGFPQKFPNEFFRGLPTLPLFLHSPEALAHGPLCPAPCGRKVQAQPAPLLKPSQEETHQP